MAPKRTHRFGRGLPRSLVAEQVTCESVQSDSSSRVVPRPYDHSVSALDRGDPRQAPQGPGAAAALATARPCSLRGARSMNLPSLTALRGPLATADTNSPYLQVGVLRHSGAGFWANCEPCLVYLRKSCRTPWNRADRRARGLLPQDPVMPLELEFEIRVEKCPRPFPFVVSIPSGRSPEAAGFQSRATASTSTRTARGSPATWTAERAGGT